MRDQQLDPNLIDELFDAVAAHLTVDGANHEIVIIGGAALVMSGIVNRATRDVDVVALIEDGGLVSSKVLPAPLAEAVRRVAVDYGLDSNWLNSGPSDLMQFGLPPGFEGRLENRSYRSSLKVHVAHRYDIIHFKLYAMADQGSGRHEADLRALEPTRDDLLAAARWTVTHDPSPAFRSELAAVLKHLGITDADF